jgi:hypothetical protein
VTELKLPAMITYSGQYGVADVAGIMSNAKGMQNIATTLTEVSANKPSFCSDEYSSLFPNYDTKGIGGRSIGKYVAAKVFCNQWKNMIQLTRQLLKWCKINCSKRDS